VKRVLIYVLIAVSIATGVGLLAHRLLTAGNAGYVIIGYDRWVLESSLLVILITLIVAFVLFYFLVRIVLQAMSIPKAIKKRGGELRSKRSQEALIAGLVETAEGNWEKAERNLIRHAADSGAPLINYLTAARAAHARGAVEQRDEYLNLAREIAPESELAIELTRAELRLSNKQFEEALESLTHLNRIAPSHAAVLRLTHQAYAQMEDWEGLRRLLPELHRNKVLMEAEVKLLETETYSALIRQKSHTRDATALREIWATIPDHIRSSTGIQALYFAAMIEAGAGEEIEDELRRALGEEWDETLLVLYGCIELPDREKQLQHAESWLGPHPRDAVLFRVLGKLAIRNKLWAKAREYLEKSLQLEPSVEAFQLLGDLLQRQNDFSGACHLYRSGLMLASSEVVAQIEQNPSGDSAEPVEEKFVSSAAQ
jgi:HemY protein